MAAVSEARLVIANRLSELGRVERWLAELGERWALPPRTAFAVDLVINEAVTNIISYAYRDCASHEITLSLHNDVAAVTVEIVDDGEPFDPFAASPMEPPADLEHAAVGGRGIHLIRSYSEQHDYKHVAGRNRLTLQVGKQR